MATVWPAATCPGMTGRRKHRARDLSHAPSRFRAIRPIRAHGTGWRRQYPGLSLIRGKVDRQGAQRVEAEDRIGFAVRKPGRSGAGHPGRPGAPDTGPVPHEMSALSLRSSAGSIMSPSDPVNASRRGLACSCRAARRRSFGVGGSKVEQPRRILAGKRDFVTVSGFLGLSSAMDRMATVLPSTEAARSMRRLAVSLSLRLNSLAGTSVGLSDMPSRRTLNVRRFGASRKAVPEFRRCRSPRGRRRFPCRGRRSRSGRSSSAGSRRRG